MKKHITEQQYEELTKDEKGKADSFYRQQGTPKAENGPEFWDIGNMIEYLGINTVLHALRDPSQSARWLDIYGFDINHTTMDLWCDKLWEKTKRMLALDAEVNKSPFSS